MKVPIVNWRIAVVENLRNKLEQDDTQAAREELDKLRLYAPSLRIDYEKNFLQKVIDYFEAQIFLLEKLNENELKPDCLANIQSFAQQITNSLEELFSPTPEIVSAPNPSLLRTMSAISGIPEAQIEQTWIDANEHLYKEDKSPTEDPLLRALNEEFGINLSDIREVVKDLQRFIQNGLAFN